MKNFEKAAPFAVMTRVIAQSFIGTQLDNIFENYRQNQYDYVVKFSAIAAAVADVAMNFSDNFSQAYKIHKEQLGVSLQSFYAKINGTESPVAQAALIASADQAIAIQDQLNFTHWQIIPGYRCFAVDGNFLSKSEKRLGLVRHAKGAPLPGKVIARFDLQRQIFDRAYLLEDAHAQEASTCTAIAADLQTMDLVIADRNFCVVPFLHRMDASGACFIIRQHGRLKGVLLGERKRIGRSSTGQVYEQAMRLSKDEGTIVVRRISVELDSPTRDQDTELHILSNLPTDVSAIDIAEAYRRRWEIETGFHTLQMSFTCELASVGHPHAALLLFCVAMIAFNIRQVMFAAMYAVALHDEVESMSNFHISQEIAKTTPGMLIAIDAAQWQAYIPSDLSGVCQMLKQLANGLDMKKYRKSKRGPKKKKPHRSRNVPSSHISTAKALSLPTQTYP